jgi:hypothetical protein
VPARPAANAAVVERERIVGQQHLAAVSGARESGSSVCPSPRALSETKPRPSELSASTPGRVAPPAPVAVFRASPARASSRASSAKSCAPEPLTASNETAFTSSAGGCAGSAEGASAAPVSAALARLRGWSGTT